MRLYLPDLMNPWNFKSNIFSTVYLIFFSVCIGTNGRMSVPNNRENHYRNLRDRYTNCTYVDGNLELTWLQDETRDLDFLKDIREVREKLFF